MTSSKSEIKNLLIKIQKNLQLLATTSAQRDAVEAAIGELEPAAAKLDEIEHASDLEVQKGLIVKAKIDSNRVKLKRLNSEIEEIGAAHEELIFAAGPTVVKLLQEAFQKRLETITAVMRPFFERESGAMECAKRTDACDRALWRISRWGFLTSLQGVKSLYKEKTNFATLVDIEKILSEALKPTSNMQQFIPFNPPDQTPVALAPSGSAPDHA